MKCVELSKAYDSQSIFKSISLELSPDYITLLSGPSGCGKTTLLRCFTLLEPFDSGHVVIDDKTVRSRDVRKDSQRSALEVYPDVSIIFQQLFLWPHLSCRENIGLVSRDDVFTNEMAKLLHVSESLDKFPNQVSLGQKQRIAIIRALIARPKYLFVDEITSALDDRASGLVINLLSELQREGVEIFAISHNPEKFKDLNHRIFSMTGGQLNEL